MKSKNITNGGLWPPQEGNSGVNVWGLGCVVCLDNHLLFQNVKVDVGSGGLSPEQAVPADKSARSTEENVAEHEASEPQTRNWGGCWGGRGRGGAEVSVHTAGGGREALVSSLTVIARQLRAVDGGEESREFEAFAFQVPHAAGLLLTGGGVTVLATNVFQISHCTFFTLSTFGVPETDLSFVALSRTSFGRIILFAV